MTVQLPIAAATNECIVQTQYTPLNKSNKLRTWRSKKNFAHRSQSVGVFAAVVVVLNEVRLTILIRAKRVYRSHKSLWSMFSHWVDKIPITTILMATAAVTLICSFRLSFACFIFRLQMARTRNFLHHLCVLSECVCDHLSELNCLHKTVVPPRSGSHSPLRVFFSKRDDNRQSIIKTKRKRKYIYSNMA